MSVSGRPNLDYLINTTLVKELSDIQRENGYATSVASVSLPDFSLDDIDRVIGMDEVPSLMIWLVSVKEGRTPSTIGDIYPAARVVITGVVKGEGLQTSMLLLLEDLRRVMLANPQRKYPGMANPPFVGVDTYEAPTGADLIVYKPVDGMASTGVFVSSWVLEYNFPVTTG